MNRFSQFLSRVSFSAALNRPVAIAVVAACTEILASTSAQAALGVNVEANGWPDDARRNAAINSLTAVTNRFNIYGDFGNYNVYAYYNAGIPTAQANYLGSIGYGGTYPNERVTQHELNHYLGSGTINEWYNNIDQYGGWIGANVSKLIQQFEGDGARIYRAGVHFYGYGLNYDSEVNSDSVFMRNVAIMYAMRQDMGNGNLNNPWSATNVTLTASDPVGTSAFNWFGGGWSGTYQGWSDKYFPHSGAAYSTGTFSIRTPQGYPSWTFGGDSLTVNAGGQLLFNGWGTDGVVTISQLTLDGGTVKHDQFAQDLFQLRGNVTLVGTPTINAANGNIKILSTVGGAGSLNLIGGYTHTFTGPNTFSGDLNINSTTLVADRGNNLLNPTSSALGNPQVARNINVNNGSTLKLAAGDTFGGANTAVVSTLVINAGGTVTNAGNNFTTLGPVQLNGGTLTGTGGAVPGYQIYNLRGAVTVGGTSASTISGTGANSGYHLAAPTTFNVADVSTGTDLTVSAPLINQDATHGGPGGLTKTGAGAMVLAAANTYTGATNVNGGTLAFTKAQSTIGSLTVADTAGLSIQASGAGSTPLTTSSLTLGTSGATSLTFDFNLLDTTAPMISTGAFTANGTVNLVLQNGSVLLSGNHTLVGYTSFLGGGTFNGSPFTLGPRSMATLANNGTNALVLNVVADRPVWTGLDSGGGWRVGATGANKNWKLQSAATATDFIQDDNVLFDDNAAGGATVAVNITIANVSPVATTFNNSTSKNYTIAGGFGIAGPGALIKSGTGTLTVATPNTFTGNVTVNGGTFAAAFGANDFTTNGRASGSFGNEQTAGKTVTINSGGTVSFTAGNVLGSGGSTIAQAPIMAFVVNQGGVLQTAAAAAGGNTGGGDANIFGPITLNGGTFTTGNGYNADYQAAIFLKEVTIGGSSPSIINSNAANALANGIMLGDAVSGTDAITFNVADVTGNANVDLTVSAKLTNSANSTSNNAALGALTKTGSGTMLLSGVNTYGGGTTISAGTISISDDTNIGANASAVTLNGGTLKTTAFVFNTHPITVGTSGGTINVSTTGQYFFNIVNLLRGSGALSLTGTGTLTANTGNLRLNQSNTYSGALTVKDGGILEYGAAGALATGASLTIANQGEVAVNNGVTLPNNIVVTGGTNSVLSFENGATGVFSGSIGLNANAVVGLRNWYNYAGVTSGTISGVISGAGNLTVNSGTGTGGTLTLTAFNTFTGNVDVDRATLVANNNNIQDGPTGSALGNPQVARNININNGGVVSLNSGNVLGGGGSLIAVAPALTFVVNQGGLLRTTPGNAGGGGQGDANIFGPITLNGGTLTTGNGYNADYQAAIFLKDITVGGTSVSTINSNATIAGSDGIMLGDSANGTDIITFNVADATGNANADLIVSAKLTNSAVSATNTAAIGALTKTGLGTMLLSGANTYTGTTFVKNGTLAVSGTIASPGSDVSSGEGNGGSGTFNLLSGGLVSGDEVWFGNAGAPGNTATGTGTVSASGVLNSSRWMVVGRSGNASSSGTLTVDGGTLNVKTGGAAGNLEVGVFDAVSATLNINAGSQVNLLSNANVLLGSQNTSGNGTVIQNGGAVTFYSDAGSTVGGTGALTLGAGSSSGAYTYNLNGGILTVPKVNRTSGNGSGAFNFNGGTLKAGANSTTFMTGLTQANVLAGGAVVDSNGFNVTIGQALLSGAENDGGMMKKGAGTLTLSTANTYIGPTVIEAGTLALTGSISGSASITAKAGATFDVSGVGGGYSLASGQTLRGNGNVAGNVAMSGGSKLAPGESPGTLAFTGNLNLSLAVTPAASAALLFELGAPANSDKVAFTTGALTIGTGVLAFNDFVFTTLGGFTNNTYTLFDGTSAINGTLDANAANLTGSLGGGFTGTLGFADGGNDLVLQVVPEPSAVISLLSGFGTLLGFRRVRRASRVG